MPAEKLENGGRKSYIFRKRVRKVFIREEK
jgi:hypothetical protein